MNNENKKLRPVPDFTETGHSFNIQQIYLR